MIITVLVVDDSLMVRRTIERCLVGAGYTVIQAVHGADALERLAAHPEIRLVVSDVNMPVMDGMQLLEHLGRLPASPPVVMNTTDGQDQLVNRARELGAKGWVIKPLKADLLLAVVRQLVGDPCLTESA